MTEDIASIAAGLTKAQQEALLSFPDDKFWKCGDEMVRAKTWRTASELGVSGNTLASMKCLGGLEKNTLLPGPMLTIDDWSSEGRHWSLTDLGCRVRTYLKDQSNG